MKSVARKMVAATVASPRFQPPSTTTLSFSFKLQVKRTKDLASWESVDLECSRLWFNLQLESRDGGGGGGEYE